MWEFREAVSAGFPGAIQAGVWFVSDDSRPKFLCCPSNFIRADFHRDYWRNASSIHTKNMNSELVRAATAVVHSQQILVNMVSRRVRQLTFGHRPMVEFLPGLGHADIALTEIIQGKLSFEFQEAQNGTAPADVVEFPGVIVRKKTGKAA